MPEAFYAKPEMLFLKNTLYTFAQKNVREGVFMKKISVCKASIYLGLLVFLFSSCVGAIQMTKMQPKLKFNTPVILNLKNYGDNDIDFFRLKEKLIRGKLINTSGEEFGYYTLVLKANYDWNLSLYMATCFLFPLIPLGFPTEGNTINLYETLYIFDSEGNLVKKYFENDEFTQVAGLYYGYNPTRRATKRFSKMTDKIFEMALLQSEEINHALKKKGPITEENKDTALKKIKDFFNPPESSSSSYIPPSPSPNNSYSPPTNNSNSSSNEPKFETGKYACSGTDFTMSFSFGSVSMNKGYTTLAMGTYKISGNQLVITFTYEAGGGNELKGKTFSYTISDSKNFYLGNERWTYVGIF